jgi:hypothetical protein
MYYGILISIFTLHIFVKKNKQEKKKIIFIMQQKKRD